MTEFWMVTLGLFVVVIMTRSLPFVMSRIITEKVDLLGKRLPAFIMMLLVIYEVNLNKIIAPPYGAPAISTLFVVVLIHWYFRNMFFSLLIGTSCYLVINNIYFF